jgi:hypothetical protein
VVRLYPPNVHPEAYDVRVRSPGAIAISLAPTIEVNDDGPPELPPPRELALRSDGKLADLPDHPPVVLGLLEAVRCEGDDDLAEGDPSEAVLLDEVLEPPPC